MTEFSGKEVTEERNHRPWCGPADDRRGVRSLHWLCAGLLFSGRNPSWFHHGEGYLVSHRCRCSVGGTSLRWTYMVFGFVIMLSVLLDLVIEKPVQRV